jgi:hypothetical protein
VGDSVVGVPVGDSVGGVPVGDSVGLEEFWALLPPLKITTAAPTAHATPAATQMQAAAVHWRACRNQFLHLWALPRVRVPSLGASRAFPFLGIQN